jgi:iron(III) transport system permease protein
MTAQVGPAPTSLGSRVRVRAGNASLFGIGVATLTASVMVLILYPVSRMFARVMFIEGQFRTDAFREVVGSPWFVGVWAQTLSTIAIAGSIALVLAGVFAWLNERTNASIGPLGDLLPLFPLLVPTIALAIGWTFLASPRIGFVNVFLNRTVNTWLPLELQFDIFTRRGLIFLYVLYFVPFAYLPITAAFRNSDPSLEEASRVSGAGILRTLRKVSLPVVAPAVLGGALLISITGLWLFSVPVVIATRAGIDILSVRIVRMLTYQFPPRFESAIVLSIFMMAILVVVWSIQRRVIRKGNYGTISGKSAKTHRLDLGVWRWPARMVIFAYLALVAVLPVAALLTVALQPFWTPDIDFSTFTLRNFQNVLITNNTTRRAFRTSATLGALGGFVVMLLTTVLAIYGAKVRGWRENAIDGVAKLPATLSNLVIAVGFLIAFAGPPFRLHATFTLLLVAYVVIYMPQASVQSTTAVSQVGRDLKEASAVSGASQGRTLRKIILPLVTPGFALGWALVFSLMVGDLAASTLLAGSRTPVLGFVMLDIYEQGTFGLLAALAATVSFMTSSVVLILMRIARPRFKRL